MRRSFSWRWPFSIWQAALFGIPCAGLLLAQGGAGRLGGVVEAEGGAPRNTQVVWVREVAVGNQNAAQSGTAALDATGQFDVQGLAAGTYALCVRSEGQNYLDPCLWGTPVRVQIAEGDTQNKAGLRLSLKRGSRLRLEFADPASLLYSPDNPTATAAVAAGVWLNSGRFIEMQHSKIRGGRQIFEAVVPPDTVIRVQVRVIGADVYQVFNSPNEDDVRNPKNTAGFGVRSAKAGLKTLHFALRP